MIDNPHRSLSSGEGRHNKGRPEFDEAHRLREATAAARRRFDRLLADHGPDWLEEAMLRVEAAMVAEARRVTGKDL